jgi:quinol monooxygenase YgiN
MIARVLRADVGSARIDEVVEAYRTNVRPIHERADGLDHHYVLVDRDAGRVVIIGVWESIDAVQAVAADLEPARQRLWSAFGSTPELEVYEVADEIVK